MVTGPAKQTERQPAVLGERYLLWGDVRLDGRAELLAELAIGNMPIDPQASSEELLLLAWERWGQACLQRVIGDYSFGLWDAQEECFWCARDFVGPRPFFMQTPAVSSPSATHWRFFGKCRRCQGRSMRNFLEISSWRVAAKTRR